MDGQGDRGSSRLTGISDITGRLVKIRHALDADMVFIEEKLRDHHLDTGDAEKSQFVIASEDDEIIGFGRQKTIEGRGEISCVLVFDEKKRKGVTELILKHLLEYSPATTLYAVTDQKDSFMRMGFKESPEGALEELDITCRVGEGSWVMVLKRGQGEASLDRGIELFNSGRYFEAHEAWEGPWRPAPKGSPEKLFIQGLIMVSAALDHYGKKEYAGTAKLLEKGQRLLKEHKSLGKGIDMEYFLGQVDLFYDRFRARREGIPEDEFPKIRKTKGE